MLRKLSFLLLTFSLSIGAFAQQTTGDLDKAIAQARKDFATDKRSVVKDAMALTPQNAEHFWPIYDQYEAAVTKANDDRIQLVKEYVDKYYSMTDAQAQSMAERYLNWETRRTALRKEYFTKLSQATSPSLALMFFQVENRLDLLVDLAIAAQLPALFVKAPATTGSSAPSR